MPVNERLIKDLTEPLLPDSRPEFGVTEYFKSKTAWEDPTRLAEWDLPRFSPATELVVAQRELADADSRLATKREEQKVWRKELDKRWDDLREQEELLKDAFVKFSQFVQENAEKRQRAQINITEHEKLQTRKRKAITLTKERLAELQKVKVAMEECVEKYTMYQKFLDSVVMATPEFTSVYDVMNRYKILSQTGATLAARQVEVVAEMEETRNIMNHITEERGDLVMSLKNAVAEMQVQLEQLKQKTVSWEAAVSRIKCAGTEKTHDIARVQDACMNLYTEMCRRKDIKPKLTKEQTEAQLREIKQTMVDLKKIVALSKQRAAVATASEKRKESRLSDDSDMEMYVGKLRSEMKQKTSTMTPKTPEVKKTKIPLNLPVDKASAEEPEAATDAQVFENASK